MQSICKSPRRETQHRRNVRRDLGDHPAPPLISGEKGDQGRDLLKVTQTTRPEPGLVQGSRLSMVSDASVIWRVNQGRVARAWHGAQKLSGSPLEPEGSLMGMN